VVFSRELNSAGSTHYEHMQLCHVEEIRSNVIVLVENDNDKSLFTHIFMGKIKCENSTSLTSGEHEFVSHSILWGKKHGQEAYHAAPNEERSLTGGLQIGHTMFATCQDQSGLMTALPPCQTVLLPRECSWRLLLAPKMSVLSYLVWNCIDQPRSLYYYGIVVCISFVVVDIAFVLDSLIWFMYARLFGTATATRQLQPSAATNASVPITPATIAVVHEGEDGNDDHSQVEKDTPVTHHLGAGPHSTPV